ncbi:MAG TPA: sigma-70 family RNA polymerase sigma factor [Terriglobales bacterium]|nr:sigma-70 family RNA polymerase sigma factor [Terriglobales bacterium]
MAARKPGSSGSQADAQERLLVEAAQKDPSRFSELYEQNFERVYAFILSRVRQRQTAEDLTADVFHKALAHLPGFDWRGIPFAAWLMRIASNVVNDQWKKSAREVVQDLPEIAAGETPEDVHHRVRLFRIVDQLPVDQRRVIVMRFGEDKSIRDIAEEMGRTEGAIKQLQFRGLANLRTRLQPGEHHG